MTGTRAEARELAERVVAELLRGISGNSKRLADMLLASLAREEAERARADRAEAALAELLRLAEREHGGGFFRPEEWYAARDEARALLSVREPGEEAERCPRCGLPRASHPGRLLCPAPGSSGEEAEA